jgi:DNA-binding NarL/FixJ family response regulator
MSDLVESLTNCEATVHAALLTRHPIKTIASTLGRSLGTVKVQASEAREIERLRA